MRFTTIAIIRQFLALSADCVRLSPFPVVWFSLQKLNHAMRTEELNMKKARIMALLTIGIMTTSLRTVPTQAL